MQNKKEYWDERLMIIIGGFCYTQDGGNGGYDSDDIKDFIRELIQQTRKETIEHIFEIIDMGWTENQLKEQIIQSVKEKYNLEIK